MPRDITDLIMQRTTFPADIEKLRQTCESHALVKSCQANIKTVTGATLGDNRYEIALTGELGVETRLLLKVRLDVAGAGELEAGTRTLRLTRVEILNDFEGLVAKLAAYAGIAPGREFILNEAATAQLVSALAEPATPVDQTIAAA